MAARNAVVEELLRQSTPPEENGDLVAGAGESRGDTPSKGRRAKGAKDATAKKDRKSEGGKLTVRPDILWRLHIWSKERGVTMKAIADSILDRTVPRYEVKRVGKPVEGEE